MMTLPLMAMTALMATLVALTGVPRAADETAKEAQAFVARVEAELVPLNEYSARVSWIGENFITDDTMWLRAKGRAEMARLRAANAKQAAPFDPGGRQPVPRPNLNTLTQALCLRPQ